MAALRIAFEAPDTPGNSAAAGRKPIDFAHLAAQTMGDKALEIEVLQLFARQGGGRIWVNRGFVPEAADVPPPPPGERVLSGLMRRPEETNWFSPASDAAGRRDYVRDPLRFPPPQDAPGAIVAPFTIDLPAGEAALPQGGETVMEFPNRHFEYALTWFSLAVLTPVLMLLALRRKA